MDSKFPMIKKRQSWDFSILIMGIPQSYSWPNNGNIWSPMLMRQHLYTFYSNGSFGFPCFFHHVHEGMIRFYGSCGPMKNLFNVFNRPCSPRQIPMTWELSTRNFIAPSEGTMLCKASETVLLYCQLIYIEKNPTHDSRKLSCCCNRFSHLL